MPIIFGRRNLTRVFLFFGLGFILRLFFLPSRPTKAPEIRRQGVFDLVSGADKFLDVQRHDFLQVRMGRDERPDIFTDIIESGAEDFWTRFQLP